MSMDILEGRTEVRDYRLERLTMLSDGVFAIAMTLLALELRPPDHWDRTLQSLWREEWPAFAAFAISFGVVARFWIDQRRLFGSLARSDIALTTINFLVLALATLAPFAARLVYATGGTGGAALALYMAHFAALGLATAANWIYPNLIKPGLLRKPPAGRPYGYAAGILLYPVLIGAISAALFAGLPTRYVGFAVLMSVAVLVVRRRLIKRGIEGGEGPPQSHP